MADHTNRTAVKQAVTDIRRFHESGRKSLECYPNDLPVGKWVKLTADAKMNRDRYLKCRQFARNVSKRDLAKICREIEQGGSPVGVQIVVRLLRLKGDRQRWSFLQKTIDNQWSCRDLSIAIQKKTGRRPRAGRTPVVGSAGDAVQKVLSICEQWGRLLRVMEKGGIEMRLSRGVRNELKACDSAVGRLYKRLLKAH